MSWVQKIEERTGRTLFDYQVTAIEAAAAAEDPAGLRQLLFYKTGAGKSLTALGAVAAAGYTSALVIAPPSTHGDWEVLGVQLGVEVQTMSHQKFRMPGTKLSRTMPVIGDEWHQFGGHKGQGWKKMDALAKSLKAPLIAASATPNYNDIERVYCVMHALDPHNNKGGYIEFIYRHCVTEQNPFGMEPIVTALRNHGSAAAMLASLPYSYYVEDDLDYTIQDYHVTPVPTPALDRFGYDTVSDTMISSQMHEKHVRINNALTVGSLLRHTFEEILATKIEATTGKLLIYANHATVATAAVVSLSNMGFSTVLVTGQISKAEKLSRIATFKEGPYKVMVGTATLATGTDGLDKVCDTLIILDDTEDDSLRRQLIGRIMPRGAASDASMKQVWRIVLDH